MKMLIVEDNPMIATAIERAGEQLSMTAVRATDGWDAIEKLEAAEYAAIVIDTDVARQSGYGVLTYLREEVGGRLDNVIVLTSSTDDELRRHLDERLNVIAKSDEPSDITDAIRIACGEEEG